LRLWILTVPSVELLDGMRLARVCCHNAFSNISGHNRQLNLLSLIFDVYSNHCNLLFGILSISNDGIQFSIIVIGIQYGDAIAFIKFTDFKKELLGNFTKVLCNVLIGDNMSQPENYGGRSIFRLSYYIDAKEGIAEE